MSLAAGKLRHRIELQRQVETQDEDSGAVTVQWQTQATVWAAIEPISAREFIQSAANQSEITARITIRYNASVTAAWRVKHGAKLYNIRGVLADKDSGLEYLTLPVSEGVNDGQ